MITFQNVKTNILTTAAILLTCTVVKVGKEWLIYYDNYGEKNYKASSTTDFVHFEDVSLKISLPEGHKHGTITTISDEVLKRLIEKK